jgi:hypothetical protein
VRWCVGVASFFVSSDCKTLSNPMCLQLQVRHEKILSINLIVLFGTLHIE